MSSFPKRIMPKLHETVKEFWSILRFVHWIKIHTIKKPTMFIISLYISPNNLKRCMQNFTRLYEINISNILILLVLEQALILCWLFLQLLRVQMAPGAQLDFLFQRPLSWMLVLHLLRFWPKFPKMECPIGLHIPIILKQSLHTF